ncbi:serine/threonine transporter SstT [Ruminococcus gauvreauii]|uniref:serine/threonine transporter SstT n=1 Tax=Ruminococcus gauvreauii TaxID=438033 RepID=UPI0039842C89
MNHFIKKWTDISLIKRILGGLIIGAVLGIAVPRASGITVLGDLFVGALKAVAPILVFFLVMSSLSNARNSHGGVIRTVIILYMLSTLLAAVIAVFASMAFPIELTLAEAAEDAAAPGGVLEVLQTLIMNVVANPVSSLANANYLGILAWAVLLGIAFRSAGEHTKQVLQDISSGISTLVTWIINLAPFGILGLVFGTVSTSGLDIFTQYGLLLVLLVGCMLVVTFITNPVLVYWCIRKNPFPLIFKCLKRSAITAFFTRSSAANIPVNMEVCREMGMDKDTYSVTIPLGATINMDGAAITITVMTMAAAHTVGVAVDIPTAIILSVLAALSACGASGVAGGSLLLIPMACSLFGIPDDISMQVVGVGFIIGVVQDSVETALNSSSDLLLSISAELRQWRKEGREIEI